MRLYETHVTIAADTVETLRGCDVYRLIDVAGHVNGLDPQKFADWLIGVRPDLAGEICECLREIGQ